MKVSANNGTHNHTTATKQSGHNTTYITAACLADNDNSTVYRTSYRHSYIMTYPSYIVISC